METSEHPQQARERRYWPVRAAILAVLPDEEPGISFEELVERVTPLLDPLAFPAPTTVEWYAKVVHLDLEARNLVRRIQGATELRFLRTQASAAEVGPD